METVQQWDSHCKFLNFQSFLQSVTETLYMYRSIPMQVMKANIDKYMIQLHASSYYINNLERKFENHSAHFFYKCWHHRGIVYMKKEKGRLTFLSKLVD